MGYRERIYQHYVTARTTSLAPQSVEGFRPRAPYLKKLIRDHFPEDRNARILEVGCGHGALMYFAQRAGYTNMSGVDGSPEQVAAARRLGIHEISEGDVMKTLEKLPLGSLDALIAFDVIEHFKKDEIMSFLERVFRVLKPDGRVVIHTCNGESPFGMDSFFNDFTHEVCMNRVAIAQVLKTCGFFKVQSFEDTPIVHGFKSAVRWVIWKCIRGGLRLWTAAETGDIASDAIFTRNFLTVAHKEHRSK